MKYLLPALFVLLMAFFGLKMFSGGYSAGTSESEDRYTKINIAELYIILNDDKMSLMHGMDYVFRGRVYLDSGLEKDGYFGVLRVAMVCCAADTVAAGFRIPLKSLPAGVANGDWVNVYGHAKQVGKDKDSETVLKDKESRSMSGSPYEVSVRNDYVFLPDRIEKTDRPDDGYMYKWSGKPPYNF